jgi:hypothetical protein
MNKFWVVFNLEWAGHAYDQGKTLMKEYNNLN